MAATPIPPQGTPLVAPTGAMSDPWYRFQLSLLEATGGTDIDVDDVLAMVAMDETAGDLPTVGSADQLAFSFGDEGASPDQNVALEQALTSMLYDTPEQQSPTYSFRVQLTAARTYYVRTDGNDANSGLVNSASGAFLTIQKAIDTVAALDISTFNVTVEVGDGTYTTRVILKDPVTGGGTCQLSGNVATPGNCIIAVATGDIIAATNSRQWLVRGFRLDSTSGQCVAARTGGAMIINGLMQYNTTTSYHIYCANMSRINITSNYEIIGGANRHVVAENASNIIYAGGLTITLTGTPAFSGFFAYCQRISSIIIFSQTFSGAATGTRYSVITNSVIETNGGGALYLPGNVAGAAATGGQYV